MSSEVLPKCIAFADLEEEKDLMEYSQDYFGKKAGRLGCPFWRLTYLLPLGQAKYNIALDVLQVKCRHG